MNKTIQFQIRDYAYKFEKILVFIKCMFLYINWIKTIMIIWLNQNKNIYINVGFYN